RRESYLSRLGLAQQPRQPHDRSEIQAVNPQVPGRARREAAGIVCVVDAEALASDAEAERVLRLRDGILVGAALGERRRGHERSRARDRACWEHADHGADAAVRHRAAESLWGEGATALRLGAKWRALRQEERSSSMNT